MSSRVATDVGGTFTDLASFDAATNVLTISKASTTLDVKDGVADAVVKARLDLAAIDYFVHGSTIAINTVIERKGAHTGLFSTEGFRDTLEIARGNIINAFDLMFTTAEPLVPRRRRFEIAERMLADGRVLKPVDAGQALVALRELEAAGVDAIAVCLLHSYANPENERAIKDLIAKHAAKPVFVSISSDIVREYREFERTSTSVLNAYVGPRVSGYLDGLNQFLDAGGFKGTADDHAVGRRDDVDRPRPPTTLPHDGVGTRRRNRGRGPRRGEGRLPQRRRVRHGRHDGQSQSRS